MLGHPIAHSLSPVLHRAAYAALCLTGWVYDAIDVSENGLPAVIDALDDTWAGLSLTMPLKRTVRSLLAGESALAEQVGAVNTVTITAQGPFGHNTDVHGIVQALRELPGGAGGAGRAAFGRVLILGGGATAASAVAAALELGCAAPVVLARSPARSVELLSAATRLGARPELAALSADRVAAEVAEAEVVISALPAGAADGLVGAQLLGAVRRRRPILLDVVYDPWPTALAQVWVAAGVPVAGGAAMLLHQAAAQVRLMTGHEPPIKAMWTALPERFTALTW